MTYQDAVGHDELGRTHADLRKLSLVEPEASRETSETVLAKSRGLA
jgi:hypothetical protein